MLSLRKTIKVFISCWTSSEQFNKHFQMHTLGVGVFNFDRFQEYNSAEDVDDSTHIRIVKTSILRIVRSMYLKYKEVSMDIFVEVFYEEAKYAEYPPSYSKLPRLSKFVASLDGRCRS